MGLLTAIFIFTIGLSVYVDEEAQKGACGGKIVDIYYPVSQERFAYDTDCYFTKTPINCLNCSTWWLKRGKTYEKFAKSYTDLGMTPPFPARTDTDKVFKPVKLY